MEKTIFGGQPPKIFVYWDFDTELYWFKSTIKGWEVFLMYNPHDYMRLRPLMIGHPPTGNVPPIHPMHPMHSVPPMQGNPFKPINPPKLTNASVQEFIKGHVPAQTELRFIKLPEVPTVWRHACVYGGVGRLNPNNLQYGVTRVLFAHCPLCDKVHYYFEHLE